MAIEQFTNILQKGINKDQIPGLTQESRDWFRNTAQRIKSISAGGLLASKDAVTTQMEVGRMYMFVYDPKTKADLPYYDKFPLIFPFKKTPDGFLGINLHYLPYVLRATLMDMLYNYVSDPKLNDRARLKITYDLLSSAATNKYIKPCVKRYLSNHVRSKFIYVIPKEWDIALFLPVENFAKASNRKVWADSRKIIGN
jgi:hypothetical protein